MTNSSTTTIDGRSVHFLETDGHGPAVFFVHANSSSAESFRRLFDGELGSRFRCIAVDLPGHGLSERSSEPAEDYTIPGYGKFVRSVVEHLGLTDILAVGSSLGGHALLEAANSLPLRGLIISGTPPLGHPAEFDRAFHPNPAAGFFFIPELTDDQTLQLAEAITIRADLREEVIAAIRATDPSARGALGLSAAALRFTDELDIVRNLSVPLVVLRGERDALVNGEYFESLVPSSAIRIVNVPDAGHYLFAEKPEEVGELLLTFAAVNIPSEASEL